MNCRSTGFSRVRGVRAQDIDWKSLSATSIVVRPVRFALLCYFCAAHLVFGGAAMSAQGRFKSLGIPVRKGGLMGCIAGPDGRGGEALYFNFNQLSGLLFLVQVDPDTGQARQFNAPQGPGAWAFMVGPDEKIYLGTWDGALILRIDPQQPEKGLEVVGKPSPTEDYLWQFDVGKDRKLYACTYPNAKLVRFDAKTGAMEDLGRMYATEMYARSLAVGPNGKVYVGIGTEKGDLVVFDPASGQHRSILPKGLQGAKGCSTAMPLEVFRHDPASRRSAHLGGMPGGEVYSMLEHEQKLYLCYYGGAVMNLYNPAKPFWKFGAGADCNPISFGGVGDGHLRPRAMISGPDGLIYIGSEPPYGELGGALRVWDPKPNKAIENYRHLVTNQSIASLAWEPRSGLIFGGSGNYGGGGTRPTEKEAKFFAFDPKKKEKVFEAPLVPGAVKYPATCAARGKVFTTVGDKLLVFDPQAMKVVRTVMLPGAQLDISLGQHRSGKLVGLTAKGVYFLDPDRSEVVESAEAPVPVNCGFALVDDAVYFGSKAELWRYRLPL